MAPKFDRRTAIACLLIGIGSFTIVTALLIPTYMLPRLVKTPLNLRVTTVASNQPGTESLVLDAKSLTSAEGSAKVDTDVPLISRRFLTVEDPSDAAKMTIQSGQTLWRTDKPSPLDLLTATIDRVTIDRRTGMPVDEQPNGSIAITADEPATPVQHIGLQYRFPITTDKKSYPYFDMNARKAFDINYIDETSINGVLVYHFQQTVPVTDMSRVVPSPTNRLTLPAAKWGIAGDAPVTMTRFYTNTRDAWVEPRTGAVIKGREQIHLYYARTADQPDVTILKATLALGEPAIESQSATARKNLHKLSTYGRTLPLLLAVFGSITLATGVFRGTRAIQDCHDPQ
ncbi:DUF3068 domain-containing protein [Nocardia sp. NPDC059240]|uniref:DUF3068 domain-containing protein n=1 Tax=Nocardia sp. NPDC059240 TaxID=3346786 RepID=UPI0036BC6835